MEQELAAGLGEGQIAELVEDDEVHSGGRADCDRARRSRCLPDFLLLGGSDLLVSIIESSARTSLEWSNPEAAAARGCAGSTDVFSVAGASISPTTGSVEERKIRSALPARLLRPSEARRLGRG